MAAGLLLALPAVLRAGEDALSTEVQAVFQKASTAVVKIQAEDDSGPLSGSGFFIDPDGTIFTNYSVGGESHDIVVTDGVVRFPATRVAADPRSGLAILKIEAQKTPYLPIGNSSGLAVASMVMTVGYPLNLPVAPSVGCVGGSNISVGNNFFAVTHIRANVPVQRGEGGAPLLNMDGEVVGIIESSLDGGSGCFVLPIEAAEKVRKDVVRFGEVRPGWLGIKFQKQDAQGSPVQVVGFAPGSPAEKAGVKAGDTISKVGARNVDTLENVLDAAFYLSAGDEVPLTLRRDGHDMEIKVQADPNPAIPAQPSPSPIQVFSLSIQTGS